MARETYKLARKRLHAALASRGWRASRPTLKVLWAERSKGERVWFKAQAVYLNAHSLWTDIRGMSVDDLIAHVDRVSDIRSARQDDTALPSDPPPPPSAPASAPVPSAPVSEPVVAYPAARPCKLRSGYWGARVAAEVAEGDVVYVTTRGGKAWLAEVTRVYWTDGQVSIVGTRSLDRAEPSAPPASAPASVPSAPPVPASAPPAPEAQPAPVTQRAAASMARPAPASDVRQAAARRFRRPTDVAA